MLYNSALYRWFQRKKYQYEVTMPLYMLTPTERFIFNSIVFLILSLIIIAATLYLPEHLSTIARRASFYWAGEDAQAHIREALQSQAGSASGKAAQDFAKETLRAASETLADRLAQASQSVGRVVDEL